MMEAVCTSETSVDNNFTRQYIPEDNSEHQNETGLGNITCANKEAATNGIKKKKVILNFITQ
jgi:hypothetical protein